MSRPPIHPGEILADELEELELTASELARRIGVPPNRISEIIHGRRGITSDTALRLSHWFGTTPQFWINLQAAYDMRLAAEHAGQASRRPAMGISALKLDSDAVDVSTTDLALHIVLADGRELDAPLEWFPRLRVATPEQRGHWRLIGGGQGIHWPDIDEDIAVATLLRTT